MSYFIRRFLQNSKQLKADLYRKWDLFRLCPQYVMRSQLQSTCHYTINHHVEIWHVRLGGANNMRALIWGAQTQMILKNKQLSMQTAILASNIAMAINAILKKVPFQKINYDLVISCTIAFQNCLCYQYETKNLFHLVFIIWKQLKRI